jgi:AcrR family transcriptional regulator
MERLKTEDRKEQIVIEAMKIIHDNGYMGLSIRELARKVNISEAAIYRHFISKEDIILGILGKMREFGERLLVELNNVTDVKQKLRTFILFHMEFFESLPEITSIIFSDEIVNVNKRISSNMMEMIKMRQEMLKIIISQGIEQGYIINVNSDDISTMIQGYIRLTVSKWKHSGFAFSLKDKCAQFFDTLDTLLFR